MAVAISLRSLDVSADERDLIEYHTSRLSAFRGKNLRKEAYYEGRARLRQLGISLPPKLEGLNTVVGWPGTVVDAIEERLDFLGWTTDDGDPYGLDEIYRSNSLDVDAALGHLDALIAGTAFVAVGAGYAGEPSPLVTVESPRTMTGAYDGRIRRLSSALSVDRDEDGMAKDVTLYLKNDDVRLSRVNGMWRVQDRIAHNRGRVGVAQLTNRPRASRVEGRSEISRAIRGHTDEAVRTLLGAATNREFYSSPQRWAMGVDADAFEKADGSTATGWETIMGRMLALPSNEDGQNPQVGQFTAASPAPYFDQIKGLSQLVASEGGLPATYLGFVTDNPSSADAIRQAEYRLVKRAERRQATFGRGWREVAALAILTRDGALPDDFWQVAPKWRDAATPTRAAAADEASKLVAAGVLPPDSTVTYDRLGFTAQEQRALEADKRRARMADTLAALARMPRETPAATAEGGDVVED